MDEAKLVGLLGPTIKSLKTKTVLWVENAERILDKWSPDFLEVLVRLDIIVSAENNMRPEVIADNSCDRAAAVDSFV